MFRRRRRTLGLAAVVLLAGVVAPVAAVTAQQYVPLLVYRTGPYAPNGVPFADGQVDYFAMLNARDGGIGGVRLRVEQCDTAYDVDQGVECYERMKNGGPTGAAAFSPLSTGIAYALIERARADAIPLLPMGHGRSDAADGTVFPHVFTLPTTYWSQASSIVAWIAAQEDGELAGRDLALVYLDRPYGEEPIPILERLADTLGFELHLFPVAHPGLEQRATWRDVAEAPRPDWVLLWSWGVMTATALNEAAAAGFPRDRIVGNHWAGAEVDVRPAGARAEGYLAANFHAAGRLDVHADILAHVHDAGRGAGAPGRVGEVLYNRGLLDAAITAEAIRVAQGLHGARPLTGAEVRDGFENLELDAARLAELGLAGFMNPVALSCADHEGGGAVFIQRWDGEAWARASDWVPPMTDLVRPAIEQSAAAYAAEHGIAPRSCGEG